jgi:hypothetical protein
MCSGRSPIVRPMSLTNRGEFFFWNHANWASCEPATLMSCRILRRRQSTNQCNRRSTTKTSATGSPFHQYRPRSLSDSLNTLDQSCKDGWLAANVCGQNVLREPCSRRGPRSTCTLPTCTPLLCCAPPQIARTRRRLGDCLTLGVMSNQRIQQSAVLSALFLLAMHVSRNSLERII